MASSAESRIAKELSDVCKVRDEMSLIMYVSVHVGR